jgi:hypothetical protein
MKKIFKDVYDIHFSNPSRGFELMVAFMCDEKYAQERFKIGVKKFRIESFNRGEKSGLIEVEFED